MKYRCREYNFNWVGISNVFGKVRKHEKTHFKNSELKILRMKIK